MILEVGIICFTVYVIFGDYVDAKAEMLRELAREKEIENNRKELGSDDEA